MTQQVISPPSDGNAYCPYGSEEQPNSPCGTVLDLLAAGFLAFLFPEGIPAEIASIVEGWNPGQFAVGALCAAGPPTCAPFSLGWLLSLSPLALQAEVATWLLCQAQLWGWNRCCQCSPPAVPGCTNVQSGTFPASLTDQQAVFCLPTPVTGSFTAQYQIFVTEPISPGDQVGIKVMLGSTCPTIGTTVQSYCFGPGQDYAYGDTLMTEPVALGEGNSTAVIGLSAPATSVCPGVLTGAVIQYVLCLTPTSPVVINNPAPPPSLPPSLPELPSGFTPGQYALGGGTGFCNFGPVSANWIERVVAPPSEVLTGSVDVEGAGTWDLPAGTVGVAVQLTQTPSNQSKDAGDPPELYQVGWVQWQDGDGNQIGPRILLTFEQQLLWGAPPIAVVLAYNLYPGVAASFFAYNTETPP